MKIHTFKMSPFVYSLLLLAAAPIANASDVEDLTAMLNEFLSASSTEAAHERFWAEDLVYTSSRGSRTTKAEIMASFADVENEGDEPAQSEEAGPVYTAEDIQIQLYGDTAVVAFKLVGTTTSTSDAEAEMQYYYNTGTFLRRDGQWQVVAWQATIIPAE